MRTVVLCKPVAAQELDLIRKSGWREFPPDVPGRIFYLNEDRVKEITLYLDLKAAGLCAYARFKIDADYLESDPRRLAAGAVYDELLVPDSHLEEFNQQIVGLIEVVQMRNK